MRCAIITKRRLVAQLARTKGAFGQGFYGWPISYNKRIKCNLCCKECWGTFSPRFLEVDLFLCVVG